MPSTKFDVDISGFKSGIQEGQAILKGLNAELKAADAEFKATGNSEKLATTQAKAFSSQINIQKGIVDQCQKALKAMTDAGVKPADKEYQKMYTTLMQAQTGLYEAQAAMNSMGESAEAAAVSAGNLSDSVNSIGKKMSLEQVITGINTITGGLENAAKKAVELGENIWNSIMDSAKWADDTATQAQMFGIDIETFERMQKLVTNGLDTTVEAMLKSQQKFNKNIGEGSDEFMSLMAQLELATKMYGKNGEATIEPITKDSLDLFFKAGQAIMNLGDEYEKEAAAQKLFGKSWRELVPLFDKYKSVEEYNAALANTQINSEENVKALTELNDKVGELKGNFDTLSNDVMAALAPALTDAADALNGLLTSVLEYLKTPEGQKALEDMGTAVSGLFDDLGKIDPQAVVSGFTAVFDKVVGGLQWLVDNEDVLKGVLAGVVAAWGGLKITGGALTLVKLIDGLRSLGLIGGGAASSAGAAAGGATFGQLTTKLAGFVPGVQNWVSMNGGPVVDWFTHEGPMGSVFQGTESLEGWWQRQVDEFNQRVSTFAEDWANNELVKFWTRRDANQDAAERLPSGANWLPSYMQDIQPQVTVEPEAPEDANSTLSEEIGTVTVPVQFVPDPSDTNAYLYYMKHSHANGLAYVPYDGYLARLHKGERVMPAREASRSFSSNLYVENMVMNNGTDAAGLAASIAAAQRRTMSGYGS